MVILARAVSFPAIAGTIILTATHVATLLFIAYYVAESRSTLDKVELQNALQAWQLRQLVPKEAQGALKTHGRTPHSERLTPPPKSASQDEPG